MEFTVDSITGISISEMAVLSVALRDHIKKYPDSAVTKAVAIPMYNEMDAALFGGQDQL